MMQKIRWKVCGMRESTNIRAISLLQPDYMGFIFYPQSKRYVGDGFIMPSLPQNIRKVGVFVNDNLATIQEKALMLDCLQLHGEESVEACRDIRQITQKPVIKAFGVDSSFEMQQLEPYQEVVSAYLLDTKGQEKGGNGICFDWDILKKYHFSVPLWISGGIGLENIQDLLLFLEENPQIPVEVIDVNSRFEIEPAYKDVEKLRLLAELLK
jgi:phosphoribosylanthranilate isomerase